VAVRGGGLVFLSGQVAQDPATGELVDGDVAQQADQILRNIAATLAAIGKDLDDVIRVGVYLTDMSQFGAINEAYRRHFAEPYPARTAIGGQFLAPAGEQPLDLRPPGGARSSGTVIFAMRARHSARRPHRTGASARRTRAVTLLRQPDIVGRDPALAGTSPRYAPWPAPGCFLGPVSA